MTKGSLAIWAGVLLGTGFACGAMIASGDPAWWKPLAVFVVCFAVSYVMTGYVRRRD